MAIRDKLVSSAQQWVEPGEKVQAVLGAQTVSGWWAVLSWWIILIKGGYRLIVVTDRRIAVFDTGKWSMTKPKQLLWSLPRTTRIGQPSGIWWKCETLGEKLYVDKRFHKDVEHADSLREAPPTARPASPPPEPPQV